MSFDIYFIFFNTSNLNLNVFKFFNKIYKIIILSIPIVNITDKTLFLDEITEAPVAVQAKLLRVIAEKAYRPLGATEEKIANIRLITASNVNLQSALENKTLREDLYYRISPLTLKIPSLNERKDDIPLLIQYFVNKRKKDITYGAIDLLKKHHWKGNVRELESTLERAFCLCSNNTVTKEDIIFY